MNAATPTRAVVVAPGGKNGPHAPTLMLSTDAAERRGAKPYPVYWTEPYLRPQDEWPSFVAEAVGQALDQAFAEFGVSHPLLIGRSFGVQAAGLAAERGLSAVWLSPTLRWPWVVAQLRQATAPFLLVGGAADATHWDGALARELTPYVVEIADADHGLYVPGPLAASAAVLGIMATAVEQFLDDVVWPVSGS